MWQSIIELMIAGKSVYGSSLSWALQGASFGGGLDPHLHLRTYLQSISLSGKSYGLLSKSNPP